VQLAALLRAGGESLECRRDAVAVLVPALVGPLVVEPLEEFSPAEVERLLDLAGGEQALELGQVRPYHLVIRKRDRLAARDQVAIGAGAESLP
jgi:hypothetical protein